MSTPIQVIVSENHEYMKVVPDSTDPTGIGTTVVSRYPLPIITYPNTNSGLTTSQIAAQDIPDGCKYEIIDANKVNEWIMAGVGSTAVIFSGAITKFDWDTGVSTYNMTKAKLIAHRKRRNRRYCEFAPQDAIIAKAIPGTDSDAAEATRAALRTKYATMQTEIDNASTIDEIHAILQKYPKQQRPPEADPNGFEQGGINGID
tara:strand:+ start:543 stop:1151 length:609 start_codon:yes stop_codon:yes gene_type:complete